MIIIKVKYSNKECWLVCFYGTFEEAVVIYLGPQLYIGPAPDHLPHPVSIELVEPLFNYKIGTVNVPKFLGRD